MGRLKRIPALIFLILTEMTWTPGRRSGKRSLRGFSLCLVFFYSVSPEKSPQFFCPRYQFCISKRRKEHSDLLSKWENKLSNRAILTCFRKFQKARTMHRQLLEVRYSSIWKCLSWDEWSVCELNQLNWTELNWNKNSDHPKLLLPPHPTNTCHSLRTSR